ncbi:DUF6088 family protein [Achromobacter denitrificans]
MDIENRIRRAISLRKDDVFIRAEFAQFGSPAQVSRSLRRLVESGRLVKLGLGIYAKAKPSAISGRPIPVSPVDYLIPQALEKLGVRVLPTRAVREYNERKTTQVPAGLIVNTGRRRVSRKLGFGQRFVAYENT